MNKSGTDTHRVRSFDSLGEYVDFGQNGKFNYMDQSSVDGMESFTKTKSLEEAQRLVFTWAAGAKKVDQIAQKINPSSQRARKTVRMQEVGPGTLSMGSFVMGHPAPWATLQDSDRVKKGKGKIVKVVFNMGVSAMVDTKIIENRGAACLALIQALESAGKRVEFVLTWRTGNGRGTGATLTHRITVKRAEEKLNLITLAFATVHPSMLRRIGFRAFEAEDKDFLKQIGWGYGTPNEVAEADQGDVYIGSAYGLDRYWKNVDTCREFVTMELAKQGITLK